jgi:hypothetical protein
VFAKYHRLPEWLRWVLLFPLTVLFTAIACETAAWILDRHYFFVRQVFGVGSFVLFIYLFTPRWPKWFALGVLIARFVIIAGAMSIGLAYGKPVTEEVWVDLGRELLGFAAAVILLWVLVVRTRIRSEEMELKQAGGPGPPTLGGS